MKLKVCGMRHADNISDIAKLQPDYMGFIFHKPSPRFADKDIPNIPSSIRKVGVFVDADIEEVIDKVTKHDLDLVQLHGQETVDYIHTLKSEMASVNKMGTLIIKVFSVGNAFDFDIIKPYEAIVDYFLFDTKGKLPGGNGVIFDWKLLRDYPSNKPYFLSGGIGFEQIDDLKTFLASELALHCHALDVNSRFETEAGVKSLELLTAFKIQL